MQSAHDVHLGGTALACLACLGADVIQVVFVGAVLILLAMERAELATEGADVGVIQMPIDVVEDRIAMQAPAHHVGQATDLMNVRRRKEHGSIGGGEALARLHLACDVRERGISAQRTGVAGAGRVMGARSGCSECHEG